MEANVLELEKTLELQSEVVVISDLTELQLAIIGGGCAEVCPY